MNKETGEIDVDEVNAEIALIEFELREVRAVGGFGNTVAKRAAAVNRERKLLADQAALRELLQSQLVEVAA